MATDEVRHELRLAVSHEPVEMAKAKEQKKWAKHCIYKLPASVTDLKKTAYKPRTVSFGPYHNGNPKLKAMEDHKARVLARFLSRAGKSKEECIGALSGSVAERLMDAYDSLEPKWRKKPEAFLEMMIRDGCFMLEILGYDAMDRYPAVSKDLKTQYGDKDPIFSPHGKYHMLPHIRRDMFMLENQLPLLLLEELFSIQGPRSTKGDDYIIDIIVHFCYPASYAELKDSLSTQRIEEREKAEKEYEVLKKSEHVLDVYRKLLIRGVKTADQDRTPWSILRLWCTKKYQSYFISEDDIDCSKPNNQEFGQNIIPSATSLNESRITIQTSDTTSIKNIHFYAGLLGGVLEIPPIVVDDTTQSDFLNLVAFERFHVGAGSDVTSYINFMDDIIDNDKDVKILQNRDIVSNAYGSDMAVARLFNSLSMDTTLDPQNELMCVRKRAKKRCKRVLNKFWGDLIHTYFRNPWSGITLVAAILVFGLTIVNIVFVIKDYYKKDKK